MREEEQVVTLKSIIDPQHLLQAIKNSLEHSDETAHGVTGLTFKRYTITVRKKAGLCWSVECRFRKEGAETVGGTAITPGVPNSAVDATPKPFFGAMPDYNNRGSGGDSHHMQLDFSPSCRRA